MQFLLVLSLLTYLLLLSLGASDSNIQPRANPSSDHCRFLLPKYTIFCQCPWSIDVSLPHGLERMALHCFSLGGIKLHFPFWRFEVCCALVVLAESCCYSDRFQPIVRLLPKVYTVVV
jgi:hypothetical protein